jgi:hypothetical protein
MARDISGAGLLALAQIKEVGLFLWLPAHSTAHPTAVLANQGSSVIRHNTVQRLIDAGYLLEEVDLEGGYDVIVTAKGLAALKTRPEVVGRVAGTQQTQEILRELGIGTRLSGPNTPSRRL